MQATRQPRRFVALALAIALAGAACSSGDDDGTAEAGDTTTEPSATSTTAADRLPPLEDDAGDCVDSSNGEPVPECPTPGIDIRSVTVSRGSVKVAFGFAAPGRPSLPDEWRAFLAMDVDNDAATGVRRLFKLNDETIGSDIDLDAVPAPDGSGGVAVTVKVWSQDAQPLGTYGEAEGATAAWKDDTTLEVVVPDAALQAAVDRGGDGGGAAQGGAVTLARAQIDFIEALIFYACMETSMGRNDFKDCLRAAGVTIPTDWFTGSG